MDSKDIVAALLTGAAILTLGLGFGFLFGEKKAERVYAELMQELQEEIDIRNSVDQQLKDVGAQQWCEVMQERWSAVTDRQVPK